MSASRRRVGVCEDPGPGSAHCTDQTWHRYSHYDATKDVSWNDGQWEMGFFDGVPHECGRPGCPEPYTAAYANAQSTIRAAGRGESEER